MEFNEVFDRVKKVIVNELSVEENKIALESNLEEDFGADSLDAIELICSLEEEFGIEIPDEVAMDLRTVKQLVDYIASK